LLKVGVVLLFICTIAVMCYLVFISLRLLRKAEAERKAELKQSKPVAELHPKLKDQNKS